MTTVTLSCKENTINIRVSESRWILILFFVSSNFSTTLYLNILHWIAINRHNESFELRLSRSCKHCMSRFRVEVGCGFSIEIWIYFCEY